MPEQFDFDHAVMCYYIQHGKPATAAELSEYSGVPIGRIRKAIRDSRYKSDCTSVRRPVRERNYNTITHHRDVNAFQPSLAQLREELLGRIDKLRGCEN